PGEQVYSCSPPTPNLEMRCEAAPTPHLIPQIKPVTPLSTLHMDTGRHTEIQTQYSVGPSVTSTPPPPSSSPCPPRAPSPSPETHRACADAWPSAPPDPPCAPRGRQS